MLIVFFTVLFLKIHYHAACFLIAHIFYFRYDEEKRALEKAMIDKLRKSRDPNYNPNNPQALDPDHPLELEPDPPIGLAPDIMAGVDSNSPPIKDHENSRQLDFDNSKCRAV